MCVLALGMQCSLTSAEVRAKEAEARLKDYAVNEQHKTGALPSALDAFDEVCRPCTHAIRL